MRKFEADVRQRFWEREQRKLELVSWLMMALMWIMVGAVIAIAAIKG